jgi:hypothetical protein
LCIPAITQTCHSCEPCGQFSCRIGEKIRDGACSCHGFAFTTIAVSFHPFHCDPGLLWFVGENWKIDVLALGDNCTRVTYKACLLIHAAHSCNFCGRISRLERFAGWLRRSRLRHLVKRSDFESVRGPSATLARLRNAGFVCRNYLVVRQYVSLDLLLGSVVSRRS